jgi:ferrochelatase
MTYGSPSSPDDVGRYLTAVRAGRAAEPGLVAEFRARYELIGGSPLIPITIAQAAALEGNLADDTIARAGMRFSEPSIETALRDLAGSGVTAVAAIVMSPQFSALLMGGYARAVEAALEAIGSGAPAVDVAGAWYREPAFVGAVAARIGEALAEMRDGGHDDVPVLLTAHSLPRRVADTEPSYIDQLRESADLIAAAAGLDRDRWTFCWQSAGHEPGEWMTPDFADLMPALRDAGRRSVLVAPIQFLADHLEILYDIDVGARAQAEAAGLEFRRIASLNEDPQFVAALAAVARRTLAAAG